MGPEAAEVAVTLARAEGPHGETVLRRRGEVLELVVDGVFAMDSAHTDTEVALAALALDRLPRPGPWHVVVGGLGLGYTARRVLADPDVQRLSVVELDGAVVGWARTGLLPVAEAVVADPRTRTVTGDVGATVHRLDGACAAAILLDVDNGPGFLVHEGNAALYAPAFLAACARALTPRGVLAVWSADAAAELEAQLRRTFATVETVTLAFTRGQRQLEYTLYLATRGP